MSKITVERLIFLSIKTFILLIQYLNYNFQVHSTFNSSIGKAMVLLSNLTDREFGSNILNFILFANNGTAPQIQQLATYNMFF